VTIHEMQDRDVEYWLARTVQFATRGKRGLHHVDAPPAVIRALPRHLADNEEWPLLRS